jgi:parvulin-like peptidyl-prolyl isomerase
VAAQEKIIAIVNNEIITQKDFNDFVSFTRLQLSGEYKGRQLEYKIQSLKNDLLNRLIEDRIILQEAKKNNTRVDENRIKAKIDEIRKRYGSDAEFQSVLKSQGIVQADLELRAREQMLMFNIIDEKIRKKIVISPAEVTGFYQKNTDLFRVPPVWDFDAVTLDEESKAMEISDSLEKGQKLEELTAKYSFTINKLNVKEGQLRKEIEEVLAKLQPRSVSKPIKIEDGYYIFRLNNVTEGRQKSLAESQDSINNIIFNKKMEEELAKWMEQLKKSSYVKIIKE